MYSDEQLPLPLPSLALESLMAYEDNAIINVVDNNAFTCHDAGTAHQGVGTTYQNDWDFESQFSCQLVDSRRSRDQDPLLWQSSKDVSNDDAHIEEFMHGSNPTSIQITHVSTSISTIAISASSLPSSPATTSEPSSSSSVSPVSPFISTVAEPHHESIKSHLTHLNPIKSAASRCISINDVCSISDVTAGEPTRLVSDDVPTLIGINTDYEDYQFGTRNHVSSTSEVTPSISTSSVLLITNSTNLDSVTANNENNFEKDTISASLTGGRKSNKGLNCYYCDRSFNKNFDLQQHVRCHTGEKPFQCIVCGRGFAQKSNVKKHMQVHKVWPELPSKTTVNVKDPTTLGCHGYNYNETPVQLSDEKNRGDDKLKFFDKRFLCSYCSFNGKTYFELKSHLSLHKREKVFKCIVSKCGQTFSGNQDGLQDFLNHIGGHKNELVYSCHLCVEQFLTLQDLGRHQSKHSKCKLKINYRHQTDEKDMLSVKDEAFSSRIAAERQKKTIDALSFSNYGMNHDMRIIPKSDPSSPPPPFEIQLSLQQKNHNLQNNNLENFSIKCENQQNKHEVSNINGNKTKKRPSNRPVTAYHKCPHCMNRYTTVAALDHHLSVASHHHPCSKCKKVFACERNLRRHLSHSHAPVVHFCTHCDKQFKTATYLKMHSIVHTDEKPFQCDRCNAAFNRRDKLSRHKLTHEATKRYKCPFKCHDTAPGGWCTKEFNRPDKLKAHMITHSGVRPHRCDQCNRSFSRRTHLREHQRSLHSSYLNSSSPTQKTSDHESIKIELSSSATIENKSNVPSSNVVSSQIYAQL